LRFQQSPNDKQSKKEELKIKKLRNEKKDELEFVFVFAATNRIAELV